MALSRVRDLRDLCILLPKDVTDASIKIPIDREVVRVVDTIGVPESPRIGRDSVLSPELPCQNMRSLVVDNHGSEDDEEIIDGENSTSLMRQR